jgi:hypothetical protein
MHGRLPSGVCVPADGGATAAAISCAVGESRSQMRGCSRLHVMTEGGSVVLSASR